MTINIDLELIKNCARQHQLRFTNHAVRRMLERAISDTEIQEAIVNGEVIEDYPADKYGPSCLIWVCFISVVGQVTNLLLRRRQIANLPYILNSTETHPFDLWSNTGYAPITCSMLCAAAR